MTVLEMQDRRKLIEAALEARLRAYAPYSGYQVGAALMTAEGKLYTGCNIENASYGATSCAERTAVFKAVSEGERNFTAIAITGAGKDQTFSEYAYPCGVCRQVLREFCDPDFVILVAKSTEDYLEYTLGELLPHGFAGRTKE